MFCQYKNGSLSSSTDYVRPQWQFLSSATVWTLLECRGDDVILFYFQQEVNLQSRPTGRARGTRTSLTRMRYVHIHAVLSHTFLLDCLRLVFFFIFVASLAHFSLIWALIKLSLGMYTWQRDEFWMIICCHIVLDIESADNLQLGISVHTGIDSYSLHNSGSLQN